MEISGSCNVLSTMVQCLHQSNLYIKRKLHVWRVQKCMPVVGAKTALTCAGLQTTSPHVRQYWANNGDLRKFGSTFRHGTTFAPKECLHQRKLLVWRVQKCIPLVGAKPALTCAGLQTTMSHVRRYRAENGNFRKF